MSDVINPLNERTENQIVSQVVHAAAMAKYHYGREWNETGLKHLKDVLLREFPNSFWADCCFRNDVPDGEAQDFDEFIKRPKHWWQPDHTPQSIEEL